MAKTPAPKAKPSKAEEKPNRENLEVAAYYHWLNRGCPHGDSLTDWVEVEIQVMKGSKSAKK